MNTRMARPTRAGTRISADVRWSQSFRRTKPMPMFWPLPAKLNPATVMSDSTLLASSCRKCCSIWVKTARVACLEVPTGICTCTKSMP